VHGVGKDVERDVAPDEGAVEGVAAGKVADADRRAGGGAIGTVEVRREPLEGGVEAQGDGGLDVGGEGRARRRVERREPRRRRQVAGL